MNAPLDALLADAEAIARVGLGTAEIPETSSAGLQALVHDQPGAALEAERRLGRHLAQNPDDEAAFRMWRILRDARVIERAGGAACPTFSESDVGPCREGR